MQYLALIYNDEEEWDARPQGEREAIYDRYGTFVEDAEAAGVLTGGHELTSTRDATTVRIREAQTLVTDGPYIEVKEALGGFFILECESMDDALDWAARIPGAEHGAVEVRPVYCDPEEQS